MSAAFSLPISSKVGRFLGRKHGRDLGLGAEVLERLDNVENPFRENDVVLHLLVEISLEARESIMVPANVRASVQWMVRHSTDLTIMVDEQWNGAGEKLGELLGQGFELGDVLAMLL
jgi:hypothetical protein